MAINVDEVFETARTQLIAGHHTHHAFHVGRDIDFHCSVTFRGKSEETKHENDARNVDIHGSPFPSVP